MAVPVVAQYNGPRRLEPPLVISDRSCLSHESAQGFRSILNNRSGGCGLCLVPNLIVLSAARAVTMEQAMRLRKLVQNGAWAIWESSPVYSNEVEFRKQQEILLKTFGVQLAEPISLTSKHLHHSGIYVRYIFPHTTILTRTFMTTIPVMCGADAVLAYYGNLSVAARFRIGDGGIVWLGSMLGPNLRAGEREATQIATAIAATTLPYSPGSVADLTRQEGLE